MFALTQAQEGHNYLPFHGNNMSFGIGGPIIPHHQFFFFFDVEPLRSANSTIASGQTFADPAFVNFATTNFPNTVGTGLLQTYVPTNLTATSQLLTAGQYFFPASATNPVAGCPTGQTNIVVGAALLPCTLPFIDTGSLSAKAVRNGTQYFGRIDKYFSHDRVYASAYRTVLSYGAPGAIPQFSAANNQNWEYAVQANWTHTFNPNTLNEGIFGVSRVEGTLGSGAQVYTVPNVSVGGMNVGFGAGFAQGDFIQKNYHWRDVLTHVQGAHTLKFGYEGWYGEDVEPFQGPYSTPIVQLPELDHSHSGPAHQRTRRNVQPRHRSTRIVVVECGVPHLGRIRDGHLEGKIKSDFDARRSLRRFGQPLVQQPDDRLRKLLPRAGCRLSRIRSPMASQNRLTTP